jgi:chromosome segregation ATPase
MNEKLFKALKQEYARLGLGDEFLQAHSEMLTATGLVTDENIESVVANQKAYLEGLQKSNDKRVTEALQKARKETDEVTTRAKTDFETKLKEKEEALAVAQKELEDVKAQAGKTNAEDAATKIAQIQAETENKLRILNDTIAELQKNNETYATQLKQIESEKAEAEIKSKQEARSTFIANKAKELGIPEYRIKEGFAISDDMDEAKIGEYLAGVSTNIKTNMLPNGKHGIVVSDKAATKDEADAIVRHMLK